MIQRIIHGVIGFLVSWWVWIFWKNIREQNNIPAPFAVIGWVLAGLTVALW